MFKWQGLRNGFRSININYQWSYLAKNNRGPWFDIGPLRRPVGRLRSTVSNWIYNFEFHFINCTDKPLMDHSLLVIFTRRSVVTAANLHSSHVSGDLFFTNTLCFRMYTLGKSIYLPIEKATQRTVKFWLFTMSSNFLRGVDRDSKSYSFSLLFGESSYPTI